MRSGTLASGRSSVGTGMAPGIPVWIDKPMRISYCSCYCKSHKRGVNILPFLRMTGGAIWRPPSDICMVVQCHEFHYAARSKCHIVRVLIHCNRLQTSIRLVIQCIRPYRCINQAKLHFVNESMVRPASRTIRGERRSTSGSWFFRSGLSISTLFQKPARSCKREPETP